MKLLGTLFVFLWMALCELVGFFADLVFIVCHWIVVSEKTLYAHRMKVLGLGGTCLTFYLLSIGKVDGAAANAIFQAFFHLLDGRGGGPNDAPTLAAV
jgi:hypothetical protein